MPAERHRPSVTVTTVPRSAVAQPHHKEIDVVLKDLKFCSRRLKATLDGIRSELRILERLYYKCKNQHRMTLFFKRVSEMRRYGQRLVELDVLERLDLLRASFIGLEHTSDLKASRASWSHVPEKPCVSYLTERLTACSTLVCKMRERLERAYHHFTLAMQTGAFVQHIILFVATSSRMSALSSELDKALQHGISTCNRLSVIIHPAGVQQLSLEPKISRPLHLDHDIPSEDAGQTVSRPESMDTSMVVVEGPGMKTEATLGASVATPPTLPTGDRDLVAAHVPKRVTTQVAEKPRGKKTRKKLDEIDQIFGF